MITRITKQMKNTYALTLIYVGLFFLASTAVCMADGWGNLKGKITVTGQVPDPVPENVDKDQATCLSGDQPPMDDNLVVGKDGALRDVFVMMLLKRGEEKIPVHPSYEGLKEEPVVLDNKHCRFEPHAVFVRTGQTLRLQNSDDVGHNCHIITFNNERNDNVPKNDHIDVKLTGVDKSPGNVVCDIHNWMDAIILVRDEPYVAVSDKDGNFEIKNIPAGTWNFQFWHKKSGYMRGLEIPGYKVGRKGEIEVKIDDGKMLDLGEMKIPSEELSK